MHQYSTVIHKEVIICLCVLLCVLWTCDISTYIPYRIYSYFSTEYTRHSPSYLFGYQQTVYSHENVPESSLSKSAFYNTLIKNLTSKVEQYISSRSRNTSNVVHQDSVMPSTDKRWDDDHVSRRTLLFKTKPLEERRTRAVKARTPNASRPDARPLMSEDVLNLNLPDKIRLERATNARTSHLHRSLQCAASKIFI